LGGKDDRRLLKILHIDPERNWGGGEVQVTGLITYLDAKGHQNHLLADPAGQLMARTQSLAIMRIPFVLRNDLDLRGVLALRRLIAREKYDVVHFHTKRAHAISARLPRVKEYPKYVVTRRMDYPETRSWYTRRLYNQRVDGVVAISRAIFDLLVGAGVHRSKIRLIHSGIDTGRFSDWPERPATPDGGCVIGCLGVLEQRKGHRELLKAQPSRPATFTLNFLLDKAVLTDESKALLPAMLEAVRSRKPTEITIFGHADASGSEARSFQLATERAKVVADLLYKHDPALDKIEIQSFGDKMPLVPSKARAAEPRNRGAEVMVL